MTGFGCRKAGGRGTCPLAGSHIFLAYAAFFWGWGSFAAIQEAASTTGNAIGGKHSARTAVERIGFLVQPPTAAPEATATGRSGSAPMSDATA